MPTKFVVLWLQTIFKDSKLGAEVSMQKALTSDEIEFKLDTQHFPSLEEAWQKYNKLVSDPVNQQVMILVPLKDFNRSSQIK